MLTEIVDTQYLLRILNSPWLPVGLLEELAIHADPEVRIAVADHPNCTQDISCMLACDENPDVRYALAENHNLAREILEPLASDPNPYVAYRARRTLSRLKGGDVITLAFEKISNGLCRPTLRPLRQF